MTTPEARPAAPIEEGQLWRLEAQRDTRAHGYPVPLDREHHERRVAKSSRDPRAARVFVEESIARRRPAMRATRAEIDALDGFRRRYVLGIGTTLEPEPSSMARTGLALGLAFASDDARG